METSPLMCYVNQWTGLYMIETSVMELSELKWINFYGFRII